MFYALWPPWRPHRPDTGSLARPPVSNPEAAGDDDDIDYEAGSGGVTGGARGESPVLRRVATAARGLASPAGGDGGGRGLL